MLHLYSTHKKTTVILLFFAAHLRSGLGASFYFFLSFFLSFLAVLPLHFFFIDTGPDTDDTESILSYLS